MALTDAHWDKIMQALQFKGGGDPGKLLMAFKENWELFGDEAALDSYLQTEKLAAMKANRDVQQSSLDMLNAEIEKLERDR